MRGKCNSVARQNSGLVGRYRGVGKQKDVVIHTKCKGTARILRNKYSKLAKIGGCDFLRLGRISKAKKAKTHAQAFVFFKGRKYRF